MQEIKKSETSMKIYEVAERIREMREIAGFSEEKMAQLTDISLEQYKEYEKGMTDLPFTFIHKCSLAFDIGINDLLEGQSAHLQSYTVTRKGHGQMTAEEDGIEISNLAPLFRNKIAEPYWVRYEYSEELQNKPIHTTTHLGQEFDLVLSGQMKVRVGDHEEVLEAGDSIYYNSSTPHGMIAIGGKDCVFLAVILPGERVPENEIRKTISILPEHTKTVGENYVKCTEDENGLVTKIQFVNDDNFNFAFDVVDAIADKDPDRLAMIHLDKNKVERRFTFAKIKRESSQAANYFKSLGIKKGDRVMVVLKRHYQFWFAMVGLHKLGAIAIPATFLLQQHDFEYRFNSAGVSAIICTSDGTTAEQVDLAQKNSPTLRTKIIVGGQREGWRSFDDEYNLFSGKFKRTEESIKGDDTMLMFFTSGTTGYPKIAEHSCKYALGHYITAKYWHGVSRDGLHLTISDTGWGKALWGKLYGQWMCEGAVFVYDFDRFDASDILPLFKKYNITTFCAPPTMLRMMIKEDISKYDLSSVRHMTTAGDRKSVV